MTTRVTPQSGQARPVIKVRNRRMQVRPDVLAAIDRMGPRAIRTVARAAVRVEAARYMVSHKRLKSAEEAERAFNRAQARLDRILQAPTLVEQWARSVIRLSAFNCRYRGILTREAETIEAIVTAWRGPTQKETERS